MGVDYKYCSKCEECLNKYCFNGCIICDERCNYCDDCDDEYLIILNRIPRFLCDDCALCFNESDSHIDLHIKEIMKENKMFRYSVIKALITEREKRSRIKNIVKLEKEVENLKVAINDQHAIIGIASSKIPHKTS